jgi:membrane fusion protein (multidrug efflux system)
VRARVSGILEKRQYDEGTPVAAGAVLFRIDRAPFEIALAQAQAAFAQERARNEQARRERERLGALATERAISQREADDSDANLKASDAALAAAQARVRDATLSLSYTTVTAPISGITGRAQRSDGSLVTAGTDSSLLTTMTQANPLWFRFAVSEQERELLRRVRGKEVRVTLLRPDGSDYPVAGRLNFEASTVDTRLGTVQLRAEFPNPKLDWLPGQYARARVTVGEENAIAVPQTAVMQGDRGRFVWIVDAKGNALQQFVEVGSWVGREWVIRSGLPAGSQVIVDNLIRMRPGAPVKPRAGAAS